MDILRKPEWLKSEKLGATRTREITRKLRKYNLHTVCESAKCPNRGECFERGTATFMILGERCTRNCSFCAVIKEGPYLPPDSEEPAAIACVVRDLKLKHVVITTVTRDDLSDGGASQFIKVINNIRKMCPEDTSIEVLISDLKGDMRQVSLIVESGPDVINHNIETIERLYDQVRPQAYYKRSLGVLKFVKVFKPEMITKSGFMIGLGETEEEVINLMQDLRNAGVDVLTIGQYIAPSSEHYRVKEYIHPRIFEYYREQGENMGFSIVESAPLVRSSYHAEKVRKLIKKRG